MAKNPVFHKRTKHVQIRYHFVREAVEQGTITLEYCRTDDILADSFTKALARDHFEKLRAGIGLVQELSAKAVKTRNCEKLCNVTTRIN